MKLFYCGVMNDHYDPRQGLSFEHQNFYESLTDLPGASVKYFPYDRILEIGKDRWNKELVEAARREKPDALFAFMYTDEFDPQALAEIKKIGAKTIAWFADDYWRFSNYSKRWARHFTHVVTTAHGTLPEYAAAGIENVIPSQWACNPRLFRPVPAEKDIDVSFVGQRKSGRAALVELLEKAGVPVSAFGSGWGAGRVSHDEMISIVSRSKVNLNLTARSQLLEPRVLARIFFRASVNHIVPDFHLLDNFRAYLQFGTPHTHARPFELAGCRAFVISGYSEGITDYYAENKEMVFYRTSAELVEKAKYYRAHPELCDRIAEAAYERTMRDHTYRKRFEDLFRRVGIA